MPRAAAVGALFLMLGVQMPLGVYAAATTYTVTVTTDDAGSVCVDPCSLRQAINAANANPGEDTIQFQIPGTGVQTISPGPGGLPQITGPVTIDGRTQTGASCTSGPTIELEGGSAGTNANGLELTAGAAASTIQGLAINRFNGSGIYSNATGAVVRCNYIGTNAAGTAALANTIGVRLGRAGTVGGTSASDRNLISGNVIGVYIQTNDAVVRGNFVGSDVTGAIDLGNTNVGINVENSSGAAIGGSTAGAGNLISGNGVGVRLWGPSNTVLGNLIGTQADGTSALGNSMAGVQIGSAGNPAPTGNSVGGTTAGDGNVIAFNGTSGVFVQDASDTTVDNRILGNSIHSNSGPGIQLGGSGVDPNDPGDADPGPNHLQNFPVLTSATSGEPGTIQGSLDSGSGSFRVELFRNSACDTSGHGEGKTYLGFVDTPANTPFSFQATLSTGDIITATATDSAGNTSEFSQCFVVTAGASLSFTVNTTDDANDGACTTAHCSLREAINRSNSVAGTDTIGFDIGASLVNGAHTIQPTSALPTIIDPVVIDGTTEPDFESCAAGPVIELDGTNAGTAFVSGLRITAGSSTVRGLVINRFSGDGLLLTTQGGNRVECNWIGTDVTGAIARANGLRAVAVDTPDNVIGGTSPNTRNLLSGNTNDAGVWLAGPDATGNIVQGNYIGTDATGTADLGNIYGVYVFAGAHDNQIGGSASGAGNVVSGNQLGIILQDSDGNTVEGNRVGLAAAGTALIGNTSHGIWIQGDSSDNTIGGEDPGAGNTIAGNNDGVDLQAAGSDVPSGNAILGNSIRANFGQGIDLGADGVTANDPNDADSGSNNLQNFPVLTSASGTAVSGAIDAAASTTFRIEVFLNSVCDPSGHGEGETLIGSGNATTDGAGDASFTIGVAALTPGDIVTATATDASGNTSEFSACFTAVAPTGTITVVKSTEPDGASQSFTFSGAVAGSITDGQELSADVAPGSHTVTEAATAGWDLTSIVCDDDDSTVDLATRTATFVVDPAEHVTCGFTNTRQVVDPPTETTTMRWCVPRNPDVWIDFTTEACGGRGPQAAPYGTITPGPAGTRYAAPSNKLAFPYVWSPDGAFPASGDFVLDIRLRFDALRNHGAGVHAHRWPDATPSGPNNPYPGSTERRCSAFGIWGDIAGGARISFSGQRARVAAPGSFHDYRLEYVDGKYLVFLDEQLVIGPITVGPQVQVDRYWIGNPRITEWGAAPWSEFTIARIAVSQPGFIDGDDNGEHDGSQAWTPVGVGPNTQLDNDADGLPNHCDPVTPPPVANGTITVVKSTEPDGASQSFTFSGAVAGSLTDGQDITVDVAPGSHTVTEAATAGWDLTAIVCDDDDSTVDLATRTATFVVDPAEHVTCGFTNTERAGQIIVVKDAQPNSEHDFTFTAGGGLSPSTFELDDNGVETDELPSSQAFEGLAAGSGYSVTEIADEAWTSQVSCSDGSPATNISVGAGETVTCTFVNEVVCENGPVVLKSSPADIRLGQLESNECMFVFQEQTKTIGAGGQPVDESPVIGGANPVLPEGSVVTSYIVHFDDATNGPVIPLSGSYEFPRQVLGVIFELRSLDDSDETLGIPDPGDPEEIPPTTGLYYEQDSDARDLEGADSYSIAPDGVTVTFNLQTQIAIDNIRVVVGTLPPGRILVVKQTDPDDATQTFDFQAEFDADGFSLADGEQDDSGPLDAGTYTVSEDLVSGWDLASATCSDGSLPSAIALGWGETVTCTFVNQQDANIVIEKQTIPDGATRSFDFSTDYDPDGFMLSDGDRNDSGDIDPGTYEVSESVPGGWELESVTCSDGSEPDAIDLSAGETVTCVFTNRSVPAGGRIVVEKQTLPDGSTQTFDFTASYDAEGFSLVDGQQDIADVSPGTYSISEVAVSGWDLTSLECDGEPSDGSVSVAAGETVTCVFTNTQRGRIIIDKVTNPAGSSQSFAFRLTGGPAPGIDLSTSLTDGSAPVASPMLLPGEYVLVEEAVSGWDPAVSSCTSNQQGNTTDPSALTLRPGEVLTCTFTNAQRGRIIIDKVTNPSGSAQSFPFRLTGGPGQGIEITTSLTDGAAPVSSPPLRSGSYELTEGAVDGWDLISATCTSNQSGNSTDPAEINLRPAEILTCTFTNAQRGRIFIDKVTNPSGSTQLFPFRLTGGPAPGVDFAANVADGTTPLASPPLRPGSYVLTEGAVEGWDLVGASCLSNQSGNSTNPSSITLRPGELLLCRFANVQRGRIIIDKVTNPSGSAQEFPFRLRGGPAPAVDFTASLADGTPPVSSPWLRPGTYNLAEGTVLDWQIQSAACTSDQSGGSTNPAFIALRPAEVVTCTFTNRPIPISLTKTQTNETGNGPAQYGDTINYRLTVTKTGSGTTSPIQVADLLLPRLQVVDLGTCSLVSITAAGTLLSCPFGSMSGSGTQSQFKEIKARAIPAGCTVTGTRNVDVLDAADGVTNGPDTICGLGGGDTIEGLGGGDTIYGNQPLPSNLSAVVNRAWLNPNGDTRTSPDPGEQLVVVTTSLSPSLDASDDILGGTGNDVIYGQAGGDFLEGQSGNDYLEGNEGNDEIWGGIDSDVLQGGSGRDRLAGDVGTTATTTTGSADHLNGGSDEDLLYGQGGNECSRALPGHPECPVGPNFVILTHDGIQYVPQMFGGQEDDRMHGGSGEDRLDGGPEGGNALVGGDQLDFCSRGPDPGDARAPSCELPPPAGSHTIAWDRWGWRTFSRAWPP